MKSFHEAGYHEKLLLLVLLLITVLTLMYLEYRLIGGRRRKIQIAGNTAACVVMISLYCMLIDDHIKPIEKTGFEPCRVAFPVVALFLITLAAFFYGIYNLLQDYLLEKRTIGKLSIKQALDDIPVGISVFRDDETLTLCNHKMLEISTLLSGKTFMTMTLRGLEDALYQNGDLQETEAVYRLADGSVWRYEKSILTPEDGKTYTLASFFDVTELSRRRRELEEQTKELRRIQMEIRRFGENTCRLAKEEEILSIKSMWHDVIGEALTTIRRLLLTGEDEKLTEQTLLKWKKSISLIRIDNDNRNQRGNPLDDLRMDAQAVGICLLTEGDLPDDDDTADVFVLAVRTCLLNAVQHAKANELYATVRHDGNSDILVITNNGTAPQGEIKPCGGLLNVKNNVEYLGGRIDIAFAPHFKLTLAVPHKEVEI